MSAYQCLPLSNYECDPCLESEAGRIRGIGFVTSSSAAFIDPSDDAEWTTKIAANEAFVIPATNGEYTEPSPVMGEGFGSQKEFLQSKDHSLTANVLYNPNNTQFFNELQKQKNLRIWFATENYVRATDVNCQAVVSEPVPSDINGVLIQKVTVTWSSPDNPLPYNKPVGIFDECA